MFDGQLFDVNDLGPLPAEKSTQGTLLATSYGQLCHINTIAKTRATDAFSRSEDIYSSYEDPQSILEAIRALLSDAPVDPLVNINPAQKGSVLGLCSLAYAIHLPEFQEQIRRLVLSGQGVILFRIINDQLENLLTKVMVFETWNDYESFLKKILAKGTRSLGKGGGPV